MNFYFPNRTGFILSESREFLKKVQSIKSEIKLLDRSDIGNHSYFEKSEKSHGFLSDLSSLFKKLNCNQLTELVYSRLDHKGRLPIHSYILGLSRSNFQQLRAISKLQYFMDRPVEEFKEAPEEIQTMKSYFSGQSKASKDSIVAGRFIIQLSQISQLFIKLKMYFAGFQPIVQHMQTLTKIFNENTADSHCWNELDEALPVMDEVIQNLTIDEYLPVEAISLKSIFSRCQYQIVHQIIHINTSGKKIPGNHLKTINRNIIAWKIWLSIQENQHDLDPVTNDQQTLKELMAFKTKIQNHLHELDAFLTELNRSLQNQKNISSFFYDVINSFDHLITKTLLFQPHLDLQLKVEMRKIIQKLNLSKMALQKCVEKDARSLQKYPTLIKSRLDYFNQEIPEVMMRGNPREIRFMAMAVNSSYRDISCRLQNSSEDSTTPKDLESACHQVKKKYHEILSNTTALLGTVRPAQFSPIL